MQQHLFLLSFALVLIAVAQVYSADAPITFSGGKSGVALTHSEVDFYTYKVPGDYEYEDDEVHLLHMLLIHC